MKLDYEIREEPDNMDDAARAVAELRSAAEQFETRMGERLTTETRAIGDRLTALETRLNRPGQEQRQDNGPTIEQRAFASFARRGVERMQADEVRALTVATDADGGYLAPESFIRELDRNLVLYSPIRNVARITQVSAGELILPKRTGTMTASWGDESDESTETQPAYGQQAMSVHEIKCYVDVSNRLLEDAAFNIDSELSADFAEEFGRAEGAAFIGGNGTKKPLGLITTTGMANVTTASATDIATDELIDLYHALPATYAARAVWTMNRTTIGKVRKMRDGEGRYVWQEPLSQGNPATILGRPVIEFPDMPDVAAGAVPVVFGDFGSGFRIFDRVNLSVLRDPYSQATKGLVRFHARRRVGGGVTKKEAFRFLKMHAA
jgi:HK97 family phage major capsid protein